MGEPRGAQLSTHISRPDYLLLSNCSLVLLILHPEPSLQELFTFT